MYFRTKQSPSGAVLQLVESVRNGEGQPRQRVVLSLGSVAIPERLRPEIAQAVETALCGREELFPLTLSPEIAQWTELVVRRVRAQGRWNASPICVTKVAENETATIDGVIPDSISHDTAAVLGPVLVARDAWQRLELDQCLTRLGLNPTQRLAAQINVINRMVEPVSENALGDWLRTTALPDLLGDPTLALQRDQHYRATDSLLEVRGEIEAHLARRQKELFGLRRTMLLYDLTNTYFEGAATENPKARRGKSKEGRDDCPQIVVGVVFDEHGFELAHEVFEGATSDSKTLATMLDVLEKSTGVQTSFLLPPESKPIVVLDGGTATKANRKLLAARGYRYVVNETRTSRGRWAEQFARDEEFEPVSGRDGRSPVKVKLVEEKVDERTESVVLCKSDGRRRKELAIRSKAEERFVAGLQALAARVSKGKLKDADKIQRSIGRLESRNTRIARFYTVRLVQKPSLELRWQRRGEQLEEQDALLGCYVLRGDISGLGAQKLWELYITLTKAEEGFRCLKSSLGLRPIRHRIEGRCDAHVLVSVIAYHLLRQVLWRLEKTGDDRRWETIRRILSTHVYATIELRTNRSERYRIRKAGRPDTEQQAIYKRLEIDWRTLPSHQERTDP